MENGDQVHVRFTKWGGGPHWTLDGVPLGRDDAGSWIALPKSRAMTRPGHDVWLAYDRVLVVLDEPVGFVASFNERIEGPEAAACSTYVDITTVPQWRDDGSVTMVDLDLDVVRAWTGQVQVEDEDEFAEHQVALGYPPDVVTHAERWRDEVLAMLETGAPPFDGRGDDWVGRVPTV